MNSTLVNAVNVFTTLGTGQKIFVFAGAGAGVDSDVDARLQLPLGADLRRAMLRKYYCVEPSTLDSAELDKDLVGKFEAEFSDPASPDQVWEHIIEKRDQTLDYSTLLAELFPPEQPVPAAYYLLARWFFSDSKFGGFATTNFDEKLDHAFHAVAESMNKLLGRDYHVASNPEGFEYHGGTDLSKVVMKIHGSLSQPWTLIGGYKRKTRFKASQRRKSNFEPYLALSKAMESCSVWIFLGYAFLDFDLVEVLAQTASRRKHPTQVFVVNRSGMPQGVQRLKEKCSSDNIRLHPVGEKADVFLRSVVNSLTSKNPLGVELPKDEKRLLRHGPEFIPKCEGRLLPVGLPKFADIIHGEFCFSKSIAPKVRDFIDSGEVQRLRNIKQLSFVNLKAQSASHDRFSHTLGVAHLADQFCSSFANGGDQRYRLPPDYDLAALASDHLHFVLSCILHDIGHGPLGHTIDLVRDKLMVAGDHERDSIELFLNAVEQGRAYADLDFAYRGAVAASDNIAAILRKTHPLGCILSNDGLDLDRLDYMLRDSYHTIPCVQTKCQGWAKMRKSSDKLASEKDVLMRAMHIRALGKRYVAAYKLEKRDILTVAAKLYVWLYDNVYFCPENLCAQAMMSIAIGELRQSGKYTFNEILRLTDVELFAELEKFGNPLVREMAYLVKYRRLYDYLGEVVYDSAVKLPDAEISEALQIPHEDRFTVLFASKGAKAFEVHFLNLCDEATSAERLAATRNRILIFVWPGAKHRMTGLLDRVSKAVAMKLSCKCEIRTGPDPAAE